MPRNGLWGYGSTELRTRRGACLPWLVIVALGALPAASRAAADDGNAAADDAVAATASQVNTATPQRIEVYPTSVSLGSPRREMQLVVTGFFADGTLRDLTADAQVVAENANIAAVAGTIVRPVADGATRMFVRAGGHEAVVPVEVSGQAMADPVSFQHETLAALTKQGCNSGACHGSPSGKGGFRLSLRAYDAALDIETLVRETFNRRTNVQEPEASLLLRKPLMEVAHGGGRRLASDDSSYAILKNWIGEGMRVDPPDAPSCTRIEVYPPRRILKRPADTQQLLVLAHFSDGSIRDITSLADFSSSDEAVALVDKHGLVAAADKGESTILVRYLELAATSNLMFLQDVEGFAWNDPPEHNFVDTHVFDKLRQLQILPSELCGDEEFLRRVYLDVIGVLPTIDETQAFLGSDDPQKRARLIDQLLERPEYAEFWALKWGDLLRMSNKKVTPAGVYKFHHWLVASLRDNQPYDRFVAELLTSSGSTFDNPPANYYRTAADTNDCTETTAQTFLGIRIQCAKCHNHPFEGWTQDNYYGIGAFFNRLQRKPTSKADELVVWVARGGEVTQPRTGKQMKPWLPRQGETDIPGDDDRRQALVAWMLAPDNPFFARAEVNRTWGHVMGRGIVEPVDDFRASNPPSNEALLGALADEFVKSGFDRKQLLRTILNSRTYQLSGRKNAFNGNDAKYFSHAKTRLLSAEQLLDAVCRVTGVDEKYAGLPAGTRATGLPSPDQDNYFLKVFGQPAREMACQCERSGESNLSQALQMINGPLVHGKLTAENNRIRQLTAAGKSDAEIIGELYLTALCRQPNEEEIAAATRHIEAQSERIQGLEDVCWALLNAKEFLFQH